MDRRGRDRRERRLTRNRIDERRCDSPTTVADATRERLGADATRDGDRRRESAHDEIFLAGPLTGPASFLSSQVHTKVRGPTCTQNGDDAPDACGMGFSRRGRGGGAAPRRDRARPLLPFDHRAPPARAGLLLDIPWPLLLDRFPDHVRLIAQARRSARYVLPALGARPRRRCGRSLDCSGPTAPGKTTHHPHHPGYLQARPRSGVGHGRAHDRAEERPDAVTCPRSAAFTRRSLSIAAFLYLASLKGVPDARPTAAWKYWSALTWPHTGAKAQRAEQRHAAKGPDHQHHPAPPRADHHRRTVRRLDPVNTQLVKDLMRELRDQGSPSSCPPPDAPGRGAVRPHPAHQRRKGRALWQPGRDPPPVLWPRHLVRAAGDLPDVPGAVRVLPGTSHRQGG